MCIIVCMQHVYELMHMFACVYILTFRLNFLDLPKAKAGLYLLSPGVLQKRHLHGQNQVSKYHSG